MTRDIVLAYLRAIEAHDLDLVASFMDPAIEVIEHPNRLNPMGARYDFAALRAAGERGKTLMASEKYDVRAMTVEGDRAVAQILWTATLQDGRTMSAHICSAIELRNGKIYRQEQYDCFV